MSRLIDADALIGELHNTYLYGDNARKVIYRKIEEQPTIEPQRIKGRWELLPGRDDEHIRYLHCSVCHFNGEYESNFCPNCGADMRGDEDAAD